MASREQTARGSRGGGALVGGVKTTRQTQPGMQRRRRLALSAVLGFWLK